MSKDYPCVYWNNGKCKKFSDDDITSWCVWNPCDSQTPSNADRIRSMSDEELALWICGIYDIEEENGKFIDGTIIPGYTPNDIEEWLQQPAEEADNEIVGERKDGDD